MYKMHFNIGMVALKRVITCTYNFCWFYCIASCLFLGQTLWLNSLHLFVFFSHLKPFVLWKILKNFVILTILTENCILYFGMSSFLLVCLATAFQLQLGKGKKLCKLHSFIKSSFVYLKYQTHNLSIYLIFHLYLAVHILSQSCNWSLLRPLSL